MNNLIYRLRFAYHLRRLVRGMSWREALRYPFSDAPGDPREDAETEAYYMAYES